MQIKNHVYIAGIILSIMSISVPTFKAEEENARLAEAKYRSLPPDATHCDPSLPIHIEMVPLTRPEAGQVTRFEVQVESALDPDAVKDSWIEYEIPDRVRRLAENRVETRKALHRSGSSRRELGIIVPDTARYEIRARLVVRLNSGQTISQTAVRWINLGHEEPPGYIGKLADQNGTGIRVYQGQTERR